MGSERFDVFVSYSHADSEWVRTTLIPHLQKTRLRVCVDYEHFTPGAMIIDAITDAMESSRYTLLVFTPSYLNSVWTQYERNAAIYTQVTSGPRIIPLLLSDCTLPKSFAMMIPVDVRNESDRPHQMNILVASIRSKAPAALLPEPESAAAASYRNFDIELTPADGGRYRLRGGCPELDSATTQTVPFSFSDVSRSVEQVRRGTADRYVCEEVGRKLHGTIFTPEVIQLWDQAAELSNVDERRVLRLRLRLNDDRLASLPWELLYKESFFMAMARTQPIVRFNGEIHMPPREDAAKRANILVADTAARRGSRTAPAIHAHLKSLRSSGTIGSVEVLDSASLEALQTALRRGTYDVLHVIAQTEQRDGRSRLMLHDGHGVHVPVDGETFAYYIRESPVRVLILSAADIGTPSEVETALAHVGAGANRAGVPAVVVIQGKVGHSATIAFAKAFYEVLAEGCPIEAGMAEGRKAIVRSAGLDTPKWALPLLLNDERDVIAFGPERPLYCFAPALAATGRGTGGRAPAEQPRTAAAPLRHNLGDVVAEPLIGRSAAVQQIRAAFAQRSLNNVVLVKSDAGVGKTAVARQFAREAVDGGAALPYDSVIWISPANREVTDPGDVLHGSAHAVTADILSFVTLKTIGAIADGGESALLALEPAARLREMASLLAEGRHLIVIDDVSPSAEDAVRAFIEAMPRSVHVVITSKRRLGIGELEVELEPLSEADTRALISRIAGRKLPMRQTFGGNPFIAGVETKRLLAGGEAFSGEYTALGDYVRALFSALTAEQQRVLAVCIELPFAADRFIVRTASKLDDVAFEAAAGALVHLLLIEARANSLVLCSTLRVLFRDADEPPLPRLPVVRLACVDALMKFLDRENLRTGRPEAPEFMRAIAGELGNMVWGMATAFNEGVFAYLEGFRNFLQHSLYVLGFWNTAVEAGEMAFLAASRIREYPSMAWTALYPLTRIHYKRANLREAERWCVTAISILENLGDVPGKMDGIIAAKRYLGRIRQSEGNYAEARRVFTEILRDVQRQRARRNQVAGAYENLAALELSAGQLDAAETFYEAALSQYQPGTETASALHELGRLALRRNDATTALTYFMRASNVLSGTVWKNRDAKISHSIGLAYEQQGDFIAAREHFRKAHQIFARLGARAQLSESDAALVRVTALQERKTAP